jgi:ATP adenylyltransferase
VTEPELRPATDYAREPDAFGRLWTPHRMAYILGEGKPPDADAGAECPFCRAPTLSDEDGLIVARGQLGYAVLNLYPYNAGHLMSVPYRHVADYTDLTPDEVNEVANITRTAMRVLRHQHVVPRWGGDTNFVPVVAHTRVLPQLLSETRRLLADGWASA